MVTTLITVERNNLHTSIGLVSCHLIDFQLYASSPLAIYLASLCPSEPVFSSIQKNRLSFVRLTLPHASNSPVFLFHVQSCSFFVVLISSWLKELIKNPWNRRQMLNSSTLIKNKQAWVSSLLFECASSSVRKAWSLAFILLWEPKFKFSCFFSKIDFEKVKMYNFQSKFLPISYQI
jgi:hypothetical protein